ncbi:MAG TPA: hypothetical protein VIJ20_10070 [Solirubrobacteraceae bacterium]
MSERLARALGGLIERRTSRRSLFARSAVAGAALAVAPVRYLLRPETAWAVLRSADCPGDSPCNDGYSAFCCEIQGGHNRCPTGTYVGGWWKCTDYQGGRLCHEEGVRYYLDCNRVPGVGFPGGCQCANGDCGSRVVDCNQFRYGQCNTEIVETTEVVCRLVICQNPSSVAELGCNGTLMIDNAVCAQEANCLEGLAVQLPGDGGA